MSLKRLDFDTRAQVLNPIVMKRWSLSRGFQATVAMAT